MGLIWIVLEGNTPSKKNSKVISCRLGFPQVSCSSRFTSWYKVNAEQFGAKIKKGKIIDGSKLITLNGTGLPINQRARIHVHFVRDSERAFDYSNALESVQDFIVDLGILEDDNAKKLDIGCITHEVDKKDPRAIVCLEFGDGNNPIWNQIVSIYQSMRKKLTRTVNRA